MNGLINFTMAKGGGADGDARGAFGGGAGGRAAEGRRGRPGAYLYISI